MYGQIKIFVITCQGPAGIVVGQDQSMWSNFWNEAHLWEIVSKDDKLSYLTV